MKRVSPAALRLAAVFAACVPPSGPGVFAAPADALLDRQLEQQERQEEQEPDEVRMLPHHLLLAAMQGRHILPPELTLLVDDLQSPWGMAFLPDGRLLVTLKGGTLAILDAEGQLLVGSVSGLPPVATGGQGGLLDVAVDPEFADDAWIYWSFSEGGSGEEAGLSGTAVARGQLRGDALTDVETIFRQSPKVSGSGHFGSRLAFDATGRLFVTLGDRRQTAYVQDLASTLGKTVRINRDGSIPTGNPMLPDASPTLWSYGHRNPQGVAVHPDTGELWVSEHGPRGGDEINRVIAGGNYGWPLVSYGCNYGAPVGSDCAIGGGTHAPAYLEPVSTWVPVSTAPAGILFYTGALFPQWRGNLFVSALAGRVLWRITLDGAEETAREALFDDLGERIRDIAANAAGEIHLLTDSGKLLRVGRDG